MSAVMAAEYIYPDLIDWKRILEELQAAGVSMYRVALILGADWSTVDAWRKGSEPRYGYGQALLKLHRRVIGEKLDMSRKE